MPTFSLHMRAEPRPLRKPAAWLLRGAGPAVWLRTLCAARVPLEAARLYPVPLLAQDGAADAVLVTGLQLRAPLPHAVPYGVISDRLYLPVNARLLPEVSPEEIHAAFDWHLVLFRPGLGPIGYQRTEALTIAHLLSPPPRRRGNWTEAHPGILAAARLESITLLNPPSARMVIDDGRDNIGTSETNELPPLPDEPQPTLREKFTDSVNRQMAESLGGFLERLKRRQKAPAEAGGGPGRAAAADTAAGENWLDRLQKWSDNTRQRLGNHDSGKQRELNRLLDMLEKDPDQGLKYAIPAANEGGRGSASSGRGLLPQNTNFDLGRLGASHTIDPWGAPWELHQQLQRRYRELARRELNLGRHRRAAYIYAHLLLDYNAAANVLHQGGHYREAAVLYQEYLKQPLRAARCLEEGGLLLEAIQLYEAEGFHESVGDLYQRLDRREPACAAWRIAAQRYTDSGDFLAASRIYEHKIDDPDAAIALLRAAWPFTSQAADCLQAHFTLLGRLGRHADAQTRLRELRADRPPRTPLSLAECLAHVVDGYPDTAIRQDAADLARVIVGTRLAEAGYEESRMLLNALQRTDPGDRLLARDVARFRDHKRRDRLSQTKPPPTNRQNPQVLSSFHLPLPHVIGVAARRDSYFVAGISESGELTLVRGNWKGAYQTVAWRVPQIPSPETLILDAGFYQSQAVILAANGEHGSFPTKRYAVQDNFIQAVTAGTPDWLKLPVAGIAHGHHQLIWVLRYPEDDGHLSLCAHLADGSLVNERIIELNEPGLERKGPFRMLAVRNSVHIAVGSQLIEVAEDTRGTVRVQGGPILRLASSAPYTRQRIVASFAHGGVVVWPQRQGAHYENVAADLESPLFTFTRAGALVAVSGGVGQLYETGYQSVTKLTDFKLNGRQAIAVTPAAGATDFAVFDATGGVTMYQVDSES